jgi:cellulose synthase/poly-beta-1,6-N-acetylglucosamine synthase-like glycosyltransferase
MLIALAFISWIAIAIYARKLSASVTAGLELIPEPPDVASSNQDLAISPANLPTVTIIIPAYNEAENIEDCIQAALASSQPSVVSNRASVWVVDDQSTDRTLRIARSLQQELGDPRLHILAGEPRPPGEVWVGKNWACQQISQQITSDYLLFIDADVRLKPGAIAAALQKMETEQVDLLTAVPQVICGCLAEWLVQPVLMQTIMIGFNFEQVNNPEHPNAFGAGMFMLFRRSTYEKLGGHQTVAAEIVEDVELARLVKSSGFKLQLIPAPTWATVRMYRSWSSLWEGWTKNMYQSCDRNLGSMLYLTLIMVVIYPLPWLILGLSLWQGVTQGWTVVGNLTLGIAVVIITMQFYLRQLGGAITKIPIKYWWLGWLGGSLVGAIAIGSVIKTETGWGWTWRGRQLS